MANEAVNIELPKLIVRRTCADGNAIALGTILKLIDPNTVEASAADNDPFGGIAIEEKTADDGIVEIGVAMDGVWDILTDAGTDTAGAIVNIVAANTVGTAAATDLLHGGVVGKLEETAGNAEVVRVRLMGY